MPKDRPPPQSRKKHRPGGKAGSAQRGERPAVQSKTQSGSSNATSATTSRPPQERGQLVRQETQPPSQAARAVLLPRLTSPPANWPEDVEFLSDACQPSPGLPASLAAVLCAPFPPLPPDTRLIEPTDLVIANITANTAFRRHPLLDNDAHPALGQRGLFARRALPARTLIAPYLGIVHTEAETKADSEYDARVWVKAADVGDGAKDKEDIGVGIDATTMGNVARFVNDFRGIAARANVTFEDWPSSYINSDHEDGAGAQEDVKGAGVSREPRPRRGLALYTGPAGVAAGAELCVSYGKGFWEARGVLAPGGSPQPQPP